MKTLTQDRLKAVLRYEPSSGLFTWTNPPRQHPRMRDYVAGCITTGYVMIKIDGRKYKAHRLAWLYVHGDWPYGDIDHANGCPLDNRIENLRIATNSENQANRLRDRDKTVAKGVRLMPSGRYQARITINKQQHHLGSFGTEEEAQEAYLEASRSHYGEFARAA